MIIPFDVTCIRNYSLKSDTSGVPTVFELGFIDAQAAAYLQNEFSSVKIVDGKPEVQIDIANRDIEAVRLGLKGFRNFGSVAFVSVEKQYPFGKRNVVSDDIINFLKPYVSEIASQIQNDAVLSEQDEKNL